MFTMLSILLAVVAVLMSVSTFTYSQVAIGNEIADLNSAVLKQVSDNVSTVIDDTVTLCNKIAYDSNTHLKQQHQH